MWDPLKYEYDYEMWAITFFIHSTRKYSWQENFASVHSFKGALQSTDNPMLGSGNFNNIGINLMPRFANSNLLPNLKLRIGKAFLHLL